MGAGTQYGLVADIPALCINQQVYESCMGTDGADQQTCMLEATDQDCVQQQMLIAQQISQQEQQALSLVASGSLSES